MRLVHLSVLAEIFIWLKPYLILAVFVTPKGRGNLNSLTNLNYPSRMTINLR
jgi:hypothetical protein